MTYIFDVCIAVTVSVNWKHMHRLMPVRCTL